MISLHWRHNDRDGVTNHRPRGCLHKHLLRRTWKTISKLRVTGLCAGNSPVAGVTREMFPFDDVIMIYSYSCNYSLVWRIGCSRGNRNFEYICIYMFLLYCITYFEDGVFDVAYSLLICVYLVKSKYLGTVMICDIASLYMRYHKAEFHLQTNGKSQHKLGRMQNTISRCVDSGQMQANWFLFIEQIRYTLTLQMKIHDVEWTTPIVIWMRMVLN